MSRSGTTFSFRKLAISPRPSTSVQPATQASSTPPTAPAPSDGASDVAISAATTAALIAKDVGEAFSNVPYIKAIAGVVAQLVKMQEEVRLHKRRCNELLEKVFLRSKLVMENLLEIKSMIEEPEFKKLSETLQNYLVLLKQIFDLVTKLTKRGTFLRIVDRGLDELNEMDRRVDSFADDILLSNSMAQLRMLLKNSSATPFALPPNEEYTHVVPPPPLHLVDRDQEKHYLVTTFLSSPNPKVSVLGPGGIGKTALATSVLNDSDIIADYLQRFFISFEGLTTLEAVYTAFTSTLGLEPNSGHTDVQILASILERLKKEHTLLCLDNFETFWEPSGTRRKAEEVLQYLGNLPNVAMLVTIRGTQRPRGVDWAQPFMEPLKPLSMTGSQDLLTRIAGSDVQEGENSEYATKLLNAIEGLPLAVTLISYLLQDGNETPQSLWERWCEEHTRMIEDVGGAEDRLSKLDISIELSLNSARMKANPDARVVLAAMAILPDGMSTSGGWIEGLQKLLSQPTTAPPSSTNSKVETAILNPRKCTATLLNVALITNDKSTSPPRLRLLSPIRQYCLRDLPPRNDIEDAVVDMWTTVAGESTNQTMSEVHARMIPEVNNIRAVLHRAISIFSVGSKRECPRARLKMIVVAAGVYTNWTLFLGGPMTDTEVLEKAIDFCTHYVSPTPVHGTTPPSDSPTTPHLHLQLKGDALQMLGKVHLALNQYDTAIEVTREARKLHKELGDKSSEAQDLADLGFAYDKLSRREEGQEVLEEAVKLHQEAKDEYGEASTLQVVGELYINSGPEYIEKAETTLERALDIHRRIKATTHEATDIGLLARVYEERGKFQDAEQLLVSAIDLVKKENGEDKLGVAGTMVRCAMFYFRRENWEEAARWSREAVEIAESVNYTGLQFLKELVDKFAANGSASDPAKGIDEA